MAIQILPSTVLKICSLPERVERHFHLAYISVRDMSVILVGNWAVI